MSSRLRVLVLGFLNSPHVTSWSDLLGAAGYDVFVAGRSAPQYPPAPRSATTFDTPADGLPLLRSLRLSNSIGSVADELEPDVVHAHWLSEFGWIAAREGMRPLVCSAWGNDVFNLSWIGRHRSRKALQAAAYVLADSEHLARETRSLAGRELPVEVLRWGLDLERFAPGDAGAAREVFGLPADGSLITCVRGFGAIYNTELLLEAFALVRARHGDARLLLKHPGAVAPAHVNAEIERLGLRDAVSVLGNVAERQMPDLYRASDVVVSIPSSDSSPRSVWEAFACGRPVVVSDLSWARDELTSGEDALFTSLEPRAVADAIGSVLDDPALAARLGAAARELASSQLDPAVSIARVNEIYRSVLENA